MITVIIAGGSGTRLWPLSTPSYPKQLLRLTSDRTMIQMAYDRAALLGNKVYIVTEASHADALKSQLPELADDRFIIEPGRRGTGNCIVMALDYLSRIEPMDEPIAFIHADHQVRDKKGFAASFKVAAETSKENNSITLIGVEPTFPSTGFGYIKKGEPVTNDSRICYVASFKEKPDFETAKEYVESGDYYWNCGYFVGSSNVFLNEMKESAPDLLDSYEMLHKISDTKSKEYNDAYLSLKDAVIDTALIEKAKNLNVVSANFDWMDVGSFKDLHDVIGQDENGNYEEGDNVYALDTANSYIRNDDGRPIAVIGLDNIVVVNTKDGILISRKDVSHRTGEVAKALIKKGQIK